MNQEKDDEARADLDKALELNAENTTALELRARVHEKTGEIDEAIADLEKAISLNPENVGELKETLAKIEKSKESIPIISWLILLGIVMAAAYWWLG